MTGCRKNDVEAEHAEARAVCVKLNKHYNDLYENALKKFYESGDGRYEFAANYIQYLLDDIMAVNLSLGIDCMIYKGLLVDLD